MIKRLAAAAFSAGAIMISISANAASPYGVWTSEKGDVRVRLADCGGKMCGMLVWLEQSVDPRTGRPKTDRLNPDPAKRARPLIGIRVADGFVPNGENQWTGTIYNADDGHRYRARFILKTSRTARLEGCMLVVLCMGHTWRRAEGEPAPVAERHVETMSQTDKWALSSRGGDRR